MQLQLGGVNASSLNGGAKLKHHMPGREPGVKRYRENETAITAQEHWQQTPQSQFQPSKPWENDEAAADPANRLGPLLHASV